jgi:hypothetical protein
VTNVDVLDKVQGLFIKEALLKFEKIVGNQYVSMGGGEILYDWIQTAHTKVPLGLFDSMYQTADIATLTAVNRARLHQINQYISDVRQQIPHEHLITKYKVKQGTEDGFLSKAIDEVQQSLITLDTSVTGATDVAEARKLYEVITKRYNYLVRELQSYADQIMKPEIQALANRTQRETNIGLRFGEIEQQAHIVAALDSSPGDPTADHLSPAHKRRVIAFPYLKGATDATNLFNERIQNGQKFNHTEIIQIAKDIAVALRSMEEHNLVPSKSYYRHTNEPGDSAKHGRVHRKSRTC